MDNRIESQCRCEKTSSGCAGVAVARCTCGACACKTACRCNGGCSCKSAK